MNARPLYFGPCCRFTCVLLSIVMATGPSAAVMAQQPAAEDVDADGATRVAAPQAGKIDLTYVSPQAVFLAVLRPARLLRAPGSEMLPLEVFTAAGMKYLGFDPADVSEVTIFVDPPMGFQPRFGMAVKFVEPFSMSKFPEQLRAHTQPGELAGQRYLQSGQPQMPSLYMPNNRMLLVAPDASLRQMLAVSELEQTSPLFERVRDVAVASELYAVIDIATLRPMITPFVQMAVAQQGEKFPEEAKPFVELPNLISSVELTINLMSAGPNSLVVHAADAASADRLVELLENANELQQRQMAANIARMQQSDDPVERALGQYMERITTVSAESLRPAREGDSLVLFRVMSGEPGTQNKLVTVAVMGILVALLLPAVQAAREAARRNQSMNNMKQLMLGLLNYHDMRRSFPAHAIYSAEGKPLLSWRVQILPLIEEQDLYRQFHLDEPWDSPHNRALIARIPTVYQNPNLNLEEGKTNYLAVVGKDCIFDGTAKGITMRHITDGTSNTVVLVEADADQAVIWTKPADFQYDADNPTAGLGGLPPDGWQAAWADGHVSSIGNDVDRETIKAAFTRAGGEVIDSTNF